MAFIGLIFEFNTRESRQYPLSHAQAHWRL